MQLRHLRYFLGIMDAGSFRAASVRLGIAQPALSRRMAELEEELGFTLFQRSRSGVEPTAAGESYALDVRALLTGLASAQDRACALASSGEAEIRFGMIRSASRLAWIQKALRRFAASGAQAPVHSQRLSGAQLVDGLERGRLDAFVTYAEHAPRHDFQVVPVHRERIVLAMPPAHPLATRNHLTLGDLASVPFVWTARDSSPPHHDALVAACAAQGFRPQVAATVESTDVLAMVRSGIGCTFVSSSTALRPDCQQIVLKPVADLDLGLTLVFAWDARSPRLAPFAGACRTIIAAHQRLLARSGEGWARLPDAR
jgi:DNA-binding transcriptional LysR family regulator